MYRVLEADAIVRLILDWSLQSSLCERLELIYGVRHARKANSIASIDRDSERRSLDLPPLPKFLINACKRADLLGVLTAKTLVLPDNCGEDPQLRIRLHHTRNSRENIRTRCAAWSDKQDDGSCGARQACRAVDDSCNLWPATDIARHVRPDHEGNTPHLTHDGDEHGPFEEHRRYEQQRYEMPD